MNSKSISAFVLLILGSWYLIFWILIIFLVRDHYALMSMKKDIKELKSVVEASKPFDKSLLSYEFENNLLQDKIYFHEKEKLETKTSTNEESVKYDESDLDLMARLIESESGNQSFAGKMAVGTVVMNRVSSDEFPDTIEDVIFQKGQFSPVANGTIYNKPSKDSLKAAKEILSGERTLGPNVLYFYNPKIVSKTNWVRKLTVRKTIGDHVFAN